MDNSSKLSLFSCGCSSKKKSLGFIDIPLLSNQPRPRPTNGISLGSGSTGRYHCCNWDSNQGAWTNCASGGEGGCNNGEIISYGGNTYVGYGVFTCGIRGRSCVPA